MTLLDAVYTRRSRRSYLRTSIPAAHRQELLRLMELLNLEYDLHIQLIENAAPVFAGLRASYGMFQNVEHFIALIGKKEDPLLKRKLGYCGERLVLEATRMELGTCWVGGTFDRGKCPCQLAENEQLCLVVAIGQVSPMESRRETFIHNTTARKSKPLEALYKADTEPPAWFLDGVRAVQKAPSAMNRQPVQFRLKDGKITVGVQAMAPFAEVDLGIALLHFELGSGRKINLI